MSNLKYCVVHVDQSYKADNELSISFLAYQNNAYGAYLTENKNDPHICTWDSEVEAKRQAVNPCECVIPYCYIK